MTNPTTTTKTDAFDPHARFIDSQGFSYRTFGRYLVGEVDWEDRCNRNIEIHRAQGKDVAWCRVYRESWTHAEKYGADRIAPLAHARTNLKTRPPLFSPGDIERVTEQIRSYAPDPER